MLVTRHRVDRYSFVALNERRSRVRHDGQCVVHSTIGLESFRYLNHPKNIVTGSIRQGFRFGRFELDVRARELRKDGVRLRLQGQPLEVLALLLERPGEMVSRDELRRRLWPEGTHVDFEHGLNAAVKRLRSALGDVARRPRFIETLNRRGYRFIAAVEQFGESPNGPVDRRLANAGSDDPAGEVLSELANVLDRFRALIDRMGLPHAD
jgi:DNA-binding winged helix-turn-helix (wHTH) protein